MIKGPDKLCKKLGLAFKNPQLFSMALTHRSMGARNNERLEFLGDSILGFVVAEKLHDMFPEASEGVLSRLRANLVNQGVLADLARKHNIGDYLILGAGELKSGGYRRDSILSDAVEAIIGALFKDQGIETCRQWVLDLFRDKFESLTLDNWQKDPKTQLQELLQAKRLDLPEYSLITMSGLLHEQTFKVKCTIALTDKCAIGKGVSRKRAEQDAAEQMLGLLKGEK
ncbi:MAG: ribonuclease III [Gammaproteobacteria bacterium HGW-Gammaproteobacteria-3]|nr:MAG: ribonuclease III [Gammaproteobacteria bacterium HGW-Gammaproteobacteria-3]